MDEKETIQSEVKPETGLHKSIRSALRWGLVALLAFGLGALIIAFTLYIPTRHQLDKANANLEQANTTITSQTDQISTLQTDNETLQKNLDSAALHVQVLMALSGVRGASFAVATSDYAGARLSLIQASDALNNLSGMLGTDQKDVLTAMQQSAAQALTKLKINLSSAQPELDQLTKNLEQLEDNLFPNP
jgi:septal ring factor EnvC (AmiA/AmiB activator)